MPPRAGSSRGGISRLLLYLKMAPLTASVAGQVAQVFQYLLGQLLGAKLAQEDQGVVCRVPSVDQLGRSLVANRAFGRWVERIIERLLGMIYQSHGTTPS